MNSAEISKPGINAASNRRSANWDLQNATGNYSVLVVSQFSIAFFSFASVWLATRYIGAEGYGGVVAVIAASQVAQIFINWTNVGLARYGVEEFVESGEINKSFWSKSAVSLPNIILLIVLSPLWLPMLTGWLEIPAAGGWLILLHFAALALWFHVQHALQGAKLVRLQGMLLAAERVLVFIILLGLIASQYISWQTVLLAYVIAPAATAVFGIFKLRDLISWRVQISRLWLRRILFFSLPIIPTVLVGYLTTPWFNAFFIVHYLTKADLGIYNVAALINGMLMQFPTVAGTLLMSLFVSFQTEGNTEKSKMYIADVLPLLTIAFGAGSVLLGIAGSFVLPVLFGENFALAGPVLLPLIAASVVAAPIFMGYVPFYQAAALTYIATVMSVCSAIVNVAANFLLIPRYGLIGCAWATALAYAMAAVVTVVLVHRHFSIRRAWSLWATIPTFLSIGYISWSGTYLIGLALLLVSSLALSVLFRRSLQNGFLLLTKLVKQNMTPAVETSDL